jgi:predicted enzyme related to lactoylglutathione lyase
MSVEDVMMISVPVTDQGRALAFYVGTLGLELTCVDETMFGPRRVQVAAGGTTSLSLVTWLESMPAGCLRGLVLKSSDVQADYDRLVAAGVEFDGPPCAAPGAPCQAVFYDPDGNALVLQGQGIHTDSEYERAGGPGLPDPHSDGRARMLVPGCSRAS